MKPILYHGTSQGGLTALEPRGRKEDHDNRPLVFATSNEQCAFLYPIQETGNPAKPRAIMHTGEHPPILIAPHQPQYFSDSFDGRVFLVPGTAFIPSGKSPDEWISTEKVVLDPRASVRVTNANQALEKGVQLFLVTGGLEAWQPIFEEIKLLKGGPEIWRAFLIRKMEQGIITHENKKRGINPIDLTTGLLEKKNKGQRQGTAVTQEPKFSKGKNLR